MTAAPNSEARKRIIEAQATSWIDRHGDVWHLGDDGLLHTPETQPFSQEHVEKKWGPLRPVVDLLARLQDSIDAAKTVSNSESAALANLDSGVHDIYCEGGRCRCFSAVDSEDVGTIPAPVDSGAIGRLNDAERAALRLQVRQALVTAWRDDYSVATVVSSVAECLEDYLTDVVREHTDRALAEVEQRIEHGPHRLGHNVSVVCSCVRCETTHACLAIVRAARQEQGRG